MDCGGHISLSGASVWSGEITVLRPHANQPLERVEQRRSRRRAPPRFGRSRTADGAATSQTPIIAKRHSPKCFWQFRRTPSGSTHTT